MSCDGGDLAHCDKTTQIEKESVGWTLFCRYMLVLW